MLEIFIIWRLVVYIGKAAEKKGVKKTGYQIMAVLLWFSGEMIGGLLGQLVFGIESSFWIIYLIALLGAVGGAGIAFLVMKFLPEQEPIINSDSLENSKVSPSIKKFGRSGWVPILVILAALSCLCCCFGTLVFFQAL